MNPLFLAHLVADFLLQPKWLVAWKNKARGGILVHAALHILTMLIFVMPTRPVALGVILMVGTLHALIDLTKVKYQKNRPGFSGSFLFDQCVHLAVLIAAMYFIPYSQIFWKSEAGRGMTIILFFFSFGLAWWNIANVRKKELRTSMQIISLFMLIVLTFLMFLIPGALFARWPYPAP